MVDQTQIAATFDQLTGLRLQSPTLERLWQEAYGDSYPAQIRPNAFYPVEVLATIERLIGQSDGLLLAELGCGHGGAGRYLARRLGMRVTGLDISPRSVAVAEMLAADEGLSDCASFQVGDVAATGLSTGSCAAAICLDVLPYVPDKAAALREAARILVPGGWYGFTTWEQEGFSDRLGAAQVADHRPLLDACGFEVAVYEEPRDWRRQHKALLDSIAAHGRDLRLEMGEGPATFMVNMAHSALTELSSRRYVFGIGRRRR
jgi:SAM-dependent methyltransferase